MATQSYNNEIAELLTTRLEEGGFTKAENRRGEEVWEREVPRTEGLVIKVYSSVVEGAARDTGKDAIRVLLFHPETDRCITKARRVNRVGDPAAVVERALERARDTWRAAKATPHCPHCGAPMFISKAKNNVCARVCWAK